MLSVKSFRTLLIALTIAMMTTSFAPALPIRSARAFTNELQLSLYTTRAFDGSSNGGKPFWGTAYYWQVSNTGSTTEDWYFVGAKLNRDANGHDMVNTYVDSEGYVPSGWTQRVDANPINHTPWGGSGDFGISGGGASLTVHIEGDGYDNRPEFYGCNGTNDCTFRWYHDWTLADDDHWNSKEGAMVVKTPNAGYNNVNTDLIVNGGYIYHWWDWWCVCYHNSGWNGFHWIENSFVPIPDLYG